MTGKKELRNYIRGHLFDVADDKKIEEADTDIPSVIDEITDLKGNFGSGSDLQKAVLGVLSKYKTEGVKRSELVSVSRKIAYKTL